MVKNTENFLMEFKENSNFQGFFLYINFKH